MEAACQEIFSALLDEFMMISSFRQSLITLSFLLVLPIIDSNHHLHSLPILQLNPNDYPQADLILYNFRQQFHSSHSFRCLLQTESKYFYLDSSCQLLSRTSLKQICPLNYTLKLEIVLPQNTTVYQLIVQLKYPKPLQLNISKFQTNLHLPFSCNETHDYRFNPKKKEFVIGNAQIHLHEQKEEKSCQFEKNPYRIQLKENELYQNFLQVKTIASCASSHYLLASSNSKKNFDYFTLNGSTGDLSLLKVLDYETITTWKLVIQAHDRFHIPFYTYVIIDVQDVNDCPPSLSWNFPLQTIEILNDTDAYHIQIAIQESKVEQSNVIIANLIASDLDASPSMDDEVKFELKLNSSISSPFLVHGPFADSTFVLSTNEPLDREIQEFYRLNLILTDQGRPRLSSFYELSIQIIDVNDHPPKFNQSIYYLEIEENQPINTTLIHLQAIDLDRDENGRVSYELTDPNNRYVTIDRSTGIIRTKTPFNYEEMKNFTFNVIARDHPKQGQPLKTTATVHVKIRDQNDNVPKFPQMTYEFSIYENNAPHSYLGQVLASDADQSPLTYSLDHPSEEISSLFRISSTDGKISILNPLDREEHDQYTFYVIASDGLHQSTRIKITVNVLDLNDEIPRFLFPNEINDTLIIDRTYWQSEDYICQIDVQDLDQVPNHTLLLVQSLNQLKNYDYIADDRVNFQFDSNKFFLDHQGKLFFNVTNGTTLNEGVYHLAFKIIDGQNYFDEKLLKLIVVDHYDRVQLVLKKYDHLGSHLNNRISYLQSRTHDLHLQQQQKATSRHSFSPTAALDQTNKFLVFIVITVLSIILIGITFIFISLIRRKSLQQKELLKKQDSSSTSSGFQAPSDSSTTNLCKASSSNPLEKRPNLRVSNCYDYNEITKPTSLLMLNKDSLAPTPLISDNCCLLDKVNEKEIYEDQRTKTYSSWVLSTSNRPESRFSQRSNESSTFHSLNRLSIPPQVHSPTNLSQQICSPKRHSSITYESTSVTSTTTHSHLPSSSSPTDYHVTIVPTSTNNSPNTPVSSDDGFCGSSDISDPPMTTGNGSQNILSHHSYRHQPYTMMKEGIMHKNHRSPSFTALFNRLHDSSTLINATDSTRRVRFNLEPEEKHQQRTILPLPTSNSPGRLADHALRRFEELYMSRDTVLDQQSVDSSILYTNSTVV